jgi:hypothetical protein
MEEKPINPLSPFLDGITRFEQSDEALRGFESGLVSWTLSRLKREAALKQLKKEKDYFLTFDDFRTAIPDFPVYLVAEPLADSGPIHRDSRFVHPLWFKSFFGLPIVSKYEEYFSELKSFLGGKPLAMIFPRKGFLKGLILHNGDPELYLPEKSSCHLYKGKQGKTLLVQPYMAFTDHVQKTFNT